MNNLEKLIIAPETPQQYAEIEVLVKDAFATAAHSDGDEHRLVGRMRQTKAYLPQLSLVAMRLGRVVGYVMFSRIFVGREEAVAPAPLAVLPGEQGHGIGSLLMETAHSKAKAMGYGCSVVLGYPDYYARFGYVKASLHGITAPFDVPDECFMVCPLQPHAILPQGIVAYGEAFGL